MKTRKMRNKRTLNFSKFGRDVIAVLLNCSLFVHFPKLEN